MGNTCYGANPCAWRPVNYGNENVIEIIVKDTKDTTIKTVQVNASKIKKIRFILPIIKVTDEYNQEFLVYHPEDIRPVEEDLSSQTRTILVASEMHPERGPKKRPPLAKPEDFELR